MKKFNVGDLVEIDGSGGAEEYTGLRLFVVGYDETLPVLSFEIDAWEKYQEADKIIKNTGHSGSFAELARSNLHMFRGRNLFGFSEDSLGLIHPANNTKE